MNQTWENGEKPNFRPDFDPNLGFQTFFMGFTPTSSYRMFQAVILGNLKEH